MELNQPLSGEGLVPRLKNLALSAWDCVPTEANETATRMVRTIFDNPAGPLDQVTFRHNDAARRDFCDSVRAKVARRLWAIGIQNIDVSQIKPADELTNLEKIDSLYRRVMDRLIDGGEDLEDGTYFVAEHPIDVMYKTARQEDTENHSSFLANVLARISQQLVMLSDLNYPPVRELTDEQ